MTLYLTLSLASLAVAALTFYSGFGLGTLLMPVFAIFFPVEVAVAATAVVHGANSIFKTIVVGRKADRAVVVRFGLPAIAAAFVGASALAYTADFGHLVEYSLGPHLAVITPVKVVMALLMTVFALFELLPGLRKLTFSGRHLVIGGLLSGFFGGFSGHQGALRSAFLAKAGLSAESFVGTNSVIGFMVDMVRILTYFAAFIAAGTGASMVTDQWPLLMVSALSAFLGVMIGKRFLKKVTMTAIQTLTGFFLLAIALFLGLGII
ncbi:MAG: TSUP family transporter [Desulforhopalus sp.]|nr:TSUP family transporter [Desulforhopalus sp.]